MCGTWANAPNEINGLPGSGGVELLWNRGTVEVPGSSQVPVSLEPSIYLICKRVTLPGFKVPAFQSGPGVTERGGLMDAYGRFVEVAGA
jgi:hypothetical protein